MDVSTLKMPMPLASPPSFSALHGIGFNLDDLQRLTQAEKMLNDICLNGCATILKDICDKIQEVFREVKPGSSAANDPNDLVDEVSKSQLWLMY